MSIESKKQSIIAGGLITSAGLFFAKFIGLFYAIPFNSMLGTSENIAIYGVSFSIYSYLLNICTAGFPFAIATLVAKYSSKEDYATTLLIKKLSYRLMLVLGSIAMVFLLLFSTPFSNMLLPKEATNIEVMRNVLMIISIALFCVPVLSSIRGFYQGLKHMEIYALSQVLEQIARVSFLLILSGITVYIFHQDKVWSVYFGAFSTSFAAILAMIHLRFYDKKQMRVLKTLAKRQTVCSNKESITILKELILISFPYFLVALLGYSDTIINTFFLKNGLEAYYLRMQGGVDQVLSVENSKEMITIIGAINYSVLKLMSIPMILAPGFSGAIIPHITSALVQNNYKLIRKNIRDCVDIVLYIALPLCFCLFLYAKPLFVGLFPVEDNQALEVSANVMRWFSIEAILSTLGPIFTAIMMAVGMRRENLINLSIMVALKFLLTYPFLYVFGFQGLVLSSLVGMAVFIYRNAYVLKEKFQVLWKLTIRKFVIILLGLLVMFAIQYLMNMFGCSGYASNSRVMNIIALGVNGTLTICGYVAITYIFGLPQILLNFNLSAIRNKVMRK